MTNLIDKALVLALFVGVIENLTCHCGRHTMIVVKNGFSYIW